MVEALIKPLRFSSSFIDDPSIHAYIPDMSDANEMRSLINVKRVCIGFMMQSLFN
jgi:hypothetical protein